jgi:hypothetical protein
VNADEKDIWINEVEFDVPASSPQHVDLYPRVRVMRRCAVTRAIAPFDAFAERFWGDGADGEQVFGVDVVASLILVPSAL